MRKQRNTTSLWSIVESMQRTLEGEGHDTDTVDAAVTRWIAELLGRSRTEQRVLLGVATPAKA